MPARRRNARLNCEAVKESGGYTHSMRVSRRMQFTRATVVPASMPTVTPLAA